MRLSTNAIWLGLFIVPLLATSPLQSRQDQTPPAKKLPVPDKEALSKSLKLIMDVFGEDFKKANDPMVFGELAKGLLDNASASKDDPANYYVLYRELRDLAAGAGFAELALLAIYELDQMFAIDAVNMKAAALTKVVDANLGKDTAKTLAEKVLPSLIGEAVYADNYEAAIALGKAARKAAIISTDAKLITAIVNLNAEILTMQKQFARMQTFFDRLQKDPDDAEANFELGKYYFFFRGRWDKGLPFLAKSGDNPLAKLAAEDLQQPKDAHKQLALADGWWHLAAAKDGAKNEEMLRRAKYWYEQSQGQLKGLSHTKAVRRAQEVDQLLAKNMPAPAGPMGEIKKFKGHTDDVKSVAISADGRYGVSGGRDSTVRVWDLDSGQQEAMLKGHAKEVWAVAFRLGHLQVLSASWDATVRLWDVKSGTDIRRFTHKIDVNGLALSRDGNFMLTAADDRNVYLWNVQSGEEVRRYSGHSEFVYCVAFSPDGRHFASGSVDKTVRVGELATGTLLRAFEGHGSSVTNVTFAPDGRSVFSCGGAAYQWDRDSGKELRRFEHKMKTGVTANVFALALSPDGRRLYTGGEDKVIRIWDVVSGKELQQLEGHTDTVSSLALSADGYRLLSGSLDRSVRLWGAPGR